MDAAEFKKQQEEEQQFAEDFSQLPDVMREALLLGYEIRSKLAYHRRMVESLEFDLRLLEGGRPIEPWGDADGAQENLPLS